MRSICVFCGSSEGLRPEYRDAARRTGELLAKEGITLVYGGGSVGLMGAIANAVLVCGGEVIGVISKELISKELPPTDLTRLHIVNSMTERKAMMGELSDAFIALPGGFGTLSEMIEVITAVQLGLISKPCGFLNTAGYYDPLISFIEHANKEEFVRSEHCSALLVETHPEQMLVAIRRHRPIGP